MTHDNGIMKIFQQIGSFWHFIVVWGLESKCW